MKTKIDSRRISLFLLFSFGITWALALAIDFSGGLSNLKPGSTVWFLLVLAMISPALANVLTRWITKEGWKDTYLKVNFKQNRRYWLIAWVGTPLLLIIGTILYFGVFTQYFDQSLSAFSKLLAQAAQRAGKPIPISPRQDLLLQIFQIMLLAPIVNSIATLGEEFGWRAYLLQKFMPLGNRKATIIVGLIWGIWHWPVIYMGYEYGFDYPGYPWLGPIVFLWFTFIVGTFLAWLTLQSQSVWPAVIAHSALNGLAPLVLLLTTGQPDTLLGPGGVGLVTSLPFALLALGLLWRSRIFPSGVSSFGQVESIPTQAKAHS